MSHLPHVTSANGCVFLELTVAHENALQDTDTQDLLALI